MKGDGTTISSVYACISIISATIFMGRLNEMYNKQRLSIMVDFPFDFEWNNFETWWYSQQCLEFSMIWWGVLVLSRRTCWFYWCIVVGISMLICWVSDFWFGQSDNPSFGESVGNLFWAMLGIPGKLWKGTIRNPGQDGAGGHLAVLILQHFFLFIWRFP